MSWSVTSENLRSFFEHYGPVVDSLVVSEKNTTRSRGFGFVTFGEVETTRKVLAMGTQGSESVVRLEMQGKMVEIKAAEPQINKERRSSSRSHRRSPGRNHPGEFVTRPPSTQVPFLSEEAATLAPPAACYYSNPQAVSPGYMAPSHYFCVPTIYGGQPVAHFPWNMNGCAYTYAFTPPYGHPATQAPTQQVRSEETD